MVMLSHLSLLLLCQELRAQTDTANMEALGRRAARKDWRRAWPAGCREYEGRKEAKGRFCSLTAPIAGRDGRDVVELDDVTMTIGSVSRLRELAAAFGKRQARTAEPLVPTAQVCYTAYPWSGAPVLHETSCDAVMWMCLSAGPRGACRARGGGAR